MATYTDDELQIKKEFHGLWKIFEHVSQEYKTLLAEFSELSMGMSGDYSIAIEEGSTMIRVGSLIFGARN